MQDDIREQLIKQFPSDVVEILDQSGKPYYGCPTCKRAVTVGTDKCPGCGQGDCRKCPLSYIAKEKNENVYECPLKMRANCKLELM